uniref:CSON014241 protein n=1 Tax=Culicoides sonorensis TaxID=179676 RepID=A0A336L0Y4_CULSO
MSSFVLYLFYKERSFIKIAHKYIISMSMNDLIVGFLCCSIAISFFRIEVYVNDKWCQINTAFTMFILYNSLITILIASIDRYWAIAFPIHHKTKVGEKVPNCIIICAWSFSVIVSSTSFAFVGGRSPVNGLCSFKSCFLTVVSSVVAPICIISIVIFYFLIHKTLKNTLYDGIDFERKRENVLKQMYVFLKKTDNDKCSLSNKTQNLDKKILKREIKTSILLVFTVTAAIIVFIPCFVTLAIFRIIPVTMDVCVLFSCSVLYLLHPIFNSFLYVYGIPNIRKRGKITLMQIFKCRTLNSTFEFDENMQKISSMKSSSNDQLSHKSLMV